MYASAELLQGLMAHVTLHVLSCLYDPRTSYTAKIIIIEKHFFKSIYLQARQESGCLKGKASPLSIAATYILGGST